MDFSNLIEDNRRELITDVLHRINDKLRPFHESLYAFLAVLFQGLLPDDWRERWHAFVAEQEAEGFTIAESSVSELETWIEAWAKDCKLWPEHVEQSSSDDGDEANSTFIISVIPNVSGPDDTPGEVPSEHKVEIKRHLPADWRGTWISGTKGNGEFEFNDHPLNKKHGIDGSRVRYAEGFSVEAGFPPEAYYGGRADVSRVVIETVRGTDADNLACDKALRAKLKNPAWVRPNNFIWHHAGPPGSRVMELVDAKYHIPTAHSGGGSHARAMTRVAKSRPANPVHRNATKSSKGGTSKVVAVITVYLTVRDALREAGALQPEYTVLESEEYTFMAADGSLFIVLPGGWFTSAAIEFVNGPLKGQRQKIDGEQVKEYRRIAEKAWGRYVPGTAFKGPSFLPGSQRKTLPLVEVDEYGFRSDAGWIDENGVHRIEPLLPGVL